MHYIQTVAQRLREVPLKENLRTLLMVVHRFLQAEPNAVFIYQCHGIHSNDENMRRVEHVKRSLYYDTQIFNVPSCIYHKSSNL